MWLQRTVRLSARSRGFHLVTDEVREALPELGEISVGLLHLLIQHTSASLALNENVSPDVRRDFESWFDRAVPEGAPYWTHTLEGDDDMPAHIKAALLGPSLTLPIRDGRSPSAPGRASTSASTATTAAPARWSPPPGARDRPRLDPHPWERFLKRSGSLRPTKYAGVSRWERERSLWSSHTFRSAAGSMG